MSRAPKKAKLPNTRPPLDRMMQIFHEVKGNRYPNRRTLAEMLEAGVKTVQRDIDFMRDRLKISIEYHREKKGYHFSKPVQDFPMMDLTEAELVSVLVAQKALVQYRGTTFEAPLRSAFNKLIKGSRGSISVAWEDLESAIAFRALETVPPEANVFHAVSEGVRRSMVLMFEYKKLEALTYQTRKVRPYQLLCFRNQWYCIGHDVDRRAIRTFALARMIQATLLQEAFIRPETFNLQEHLRNSFGIFSGTDASPKKVILRFDSVTAQLIRERVWHISQELRNLEKGEVELSLALNSFFEIEAWIMSWGIHVRVMEPKELRDRICLIAKQISAKYEIV